jgi:hypothetical protein
MFDVLSGVFDDGRCPIIVTRYKPAIYSPYIFGANLVYSPCVSSSAFRHPVASEVLVSLVVEKRSQKAIGRRSHIPIWLLVATREFVK